MKHLLSGTRLITIRVSARDDSVAAARCHIPSFVQPLYKTPKRRFVIQR